MAVTSRRTHAARHRGGCLPAAVPPAATRSATSRDAARARDLAELAGAIEASVRMARRHAAAEHAELRRREQQPPHDPGAHQAWTLRCCRQAERYYDAVEHADSLAEDLAQVRAQLADLQRPAAA